MVVEPRTLFVVYQMGKVASLAVTRSLGKIPQRKIVFHTHSHVAAGRRIKLARSRGEKVVVVSGFREPLVRNISAYFFCMSLENTATDWLVGSRDQVRDKSINWLIRDFHGKSLRHINKNLRPWLSRYETSIGESLHDFVAMPGGLKLLRGDISYYIYKLECISEFWPAFTRELDYAIGPLAAENAGKKKWYADQYSEFLRVYRISREGYDAYYRHIPFMELLYSGYEINSLVKRFIA